jgi:hypothetical protein
MIFKVVARSSQWLDRKPDNPGVQFCIGWLLAALGNLVKAYDLPERSVLAERPRARHIREARRAVPVAHHGRIDVLPADHDTKSRSRRGAGDQN